MGAATPGRYQSDNRPQSGNRLQSRNCQANTLPNCKGKIFGLIKMVKVDYNSITVDERLNMTNQLNAIKINLAKDGITCYDVQKGNGCWMVTYGRTVLYFFFNGDTIVDVQVD